MRDYEIEERNQKTIIHFKGRKMDGIRMIKRSGAGPHQQKRNKIRGNLARQYERDTDG